MLSEKTAKRFSPSRKPIIENEFEGEKLNENEDNHLFTGDNRLAEFRHSILGRNSQSPKP